MEDTHGNQENTKLPPSGMRRPSAPWLWRFSHALTWGVSARFHGILDAYFPDRVRLPESSQSAAIAPSTRRKTAALCYDRIWGVPTAKMPPSIQCFGDTWGEQALLASLYRFGHHPPEANVFVPEGNVSLSFFGHPPPSNQLGFQIEKSAYNSELAFDYQPATQPDADTRLPLELQQWFLRAVALDFAVSHGVAMTPIFARLSARDAAFGKVETWPMQSREVVVATLSDLQLVHEESLEWNQVLQFRSDQEARRKYLRLLHWLDSEMLGKSLSFIQDEMAARIEDYEWAIRKHGIRSTLGTLQEVLDGKFLVGASVVSGSLALSGHPVLGALAGTGLVIGKATVSLAGKMLDIADAERGPNSEVSWVYDVKRDLE